MEETKSIFNSDDYQGRRQDQVETSHKAIVWAFIIFVLSMVVGLIFERLSKFICN